MFALLIAALAFPACGGETSDEDAPAADITADDTAALVTEPPAVPVHYTAEGRTWSGSSGTIVVAKRLFSAPELDSLGGAGVNVDSLAVKPMSIELRKGQRVRLDTLKINALGASGKSMSGVPLIFRLTSDVVAMIGEDPVELEGLRAGESDLTIESAVPDSAGVARAMMRIIVRE